MPILYGLSSSRHFCIEMNIFCTIHVAWIFMFHNLNNMYKDTVNHMGLTFELSKKILSVKLPKLLQRWKFLCSYTLFQALHLLIKAFLVMPDWSSQQHNMTTRSLLISQHIQTYSVSLISNITGITSASRLIVTHCNPIALQCNIFLVVNVSTKINLQFWNEEFFLKYYPYDA